MSAPSITSRECTFTQAQLRMTRSAGARRAATAISSAATSGQAGNPSSRHGPKLPPPPARLQAIFLRRPKTSAISASSAAASAASKAAGRVAVDVEHRDQLARRVEHRHHDLRPRARRAGDVPCEGVDVRDHLGPPLPRRRAADPAVERNDQAAVPALVRPDLQEPRRPPRGRTRPSRSRRRRERARRRPSPSARPRRPRRRRPPRSAPPPRRSRAPSPPLLCPGFHMA